MSKKSGKISTIVLVLLLLVGLSVMLYPTVSDWLNTKRQSAAVVAYQEEVSSLDETDYEEIIAKAHEYNEKLANIESPLVNYDELEGYEDILDITGTGIMGYITIPQIDIELPIYHGTSEGVLNIAVGHLQGSTLPVGGVNTHAVISAHRGLPSAKLFTDLDKLVEGDEFTITVLKEVYTYEVDKISIVLPDETENLSIVPGEDYVTLMTCTPYGINTHRLLVRAKRVDADTEESDEAVQVTKITADAVQVDSMLVIPYIAAPLLFGLFMWWMFGGKIIRKKAFPHNNPLSVLETENEKRETKPESMKEDE